MCEVLSRGKSILILTSTDRARLEVIAAWFAIEFRPQNDGGYVLRSLLSGANMEVFVPPETAHKRLIAEISSRAAPWIHFHMNASCRNSLLDNSDARLMRIGELYLRSCAAK